MKRIITVLLSMFTAGSLLHMGTVLAEDASADILITVTQGGNVLNDTAALTVTDADGDGLLTVYDALYLLHEEQFAGGAAAGLQTLQEEDVLRAAIVWGMDTGNAFSCYVNDVSVDSLQAPLTAGDCVRAELPDPVEPTEVNAEEVTVGAVLQIPEQVPPLIAEAQPETQPPTTAPPQPPATTTTEEKITISMTVSRGPRDANAQAQTNNANHANSPNVNVTVNNQPTNLKTDQDGKITITVFENGQAVVGGQNQNVTLNPTAGSSGNPIVINGDTGSVVQNAVNGAGQVINSAGQIVNSAGQIVNNAGQVVNGAGQVVNGAGQVVNTAGQVVNTAGQVVNTAGQVVNAAGQISNGVVVPTAQVTTEPVPAAARSSYIDGVPDTGDALGTGIIAGLVGAGAAVFLTLRRRREK